ncbi:hypothetical protein AB9K34_17695 [Sedimentitalea sp. XS_ASV28]|uniref:hypothetical protein n=1 Tax=Sedimentitalea sp. XS_ASV28 TaxID=3241296 RepID=UPI00351985A8
MQVFCNAALALDAVIHETSETVKANYRKGLRGNTKRALRIGFFGPAARADRPLVFRTQSSPQRRCRAARRFLRGSARLVASGQHAVDAFLSDRPGGILEINDGKLELLLDTQT